MERSPAGSSGRGLDPVEVGNPLQSATEQRGVIMSSIDKAKNAAQEAKGKVKETVGKISDNERLEAEGKADRSGANLKQAGENVKDVFKD